MPCACALHLPLHGPDPLWALAWLESWALGDPHGEEKGDLGRAGNGWNMLGLEPALGMEVTCASDVDSRAQQHTIRPDRCFPGGPWLKGVVWARPEGQQSCSLASS